MTDSTARSRVRYVPAHDCATCTCVEDDHEPGTLLLDAVGRVWFKSWKDRLPWSEPHGQLRPEGGGYGYMGGRGPTQPVRVLAVLTRNEVDDCVR